MRVMRVILVDPAAAGFSLVCFMDESTAKRHGNDHT